MIKKYFLTPLSFLTLLSFSGLVLFSAGCEDSLEETQAGITSSQDDPKFWDDRPGAIEAYINSVPTGASVFVNDSAVGKITDCVLLGLNCGSHYKVRLSRPGYLDYEVNVNPDAGQDPPEVNAVLMFADGSNIKLDTAYAEVYDQGYTIMYHFIFNVDVVFQNVSCEMPGYKPFNTGYVSVLYAGDKGATAGMGIDSNGDGYADTRIPAGKHKLLFAGKDDNCDQDFVIVTEVLVR